MPKYVLKCSKCGAIEERILRVAEIDSQVCSKCGCDMKVKITTCNFRMRDGRPDVIEWKKQRGVLDL